MVSDLISGEEKRQALERVIGSRTFSRSDQLRGFLRYICEAEFEGRAQDLNEYVLGVSVLGRPSDYSPAEDSCVRSRAYELRNKLKSYYRLEAPHDPVQIAIRKGAYVPQFQRATEATRAEYAPEPAEFPASTPPRAPAEPPAPGRRRNAAFAARAVLVAAVAAIPILFYLYYHSTHDRSGANAPDAQVWTPEMTAFWRPFLGASTPLVISYEVRLFFFSPSTGLVVRDFQTNQLGDVPKSKPLADFRARMGAGELQETSDYADVGAVQAAFLLGGLLRPQHKEIGLKHSSALGWEDIWNSNVIFIGKPNLNPTIRYSLRGADFVEDELGVIRNLHPAAGESAEYSSATSHGAGEKYALITVLPGPQSRHHIMILSGAGSEFVWALAEYVTDPAHIKELMSHLRQPSGECPQAFQVVLHATFESYVPIKIRYVTHRISKTS